MLTCCYSKRAVDERRWPADGGLEESGVATSKRDGAVAVKETGGLVLNVEEKTRKRPAQRFAGKRLLWLSGFVAGRRGHGNCGAASSSHVIGRHGNGSRASSAGRLMTSSSAGMLRSIIVY